MSTTTMFEGKSWGGNQASCEWGEFQGDTRKVPYVPRWEDLFWTNERTSFLLIGGNGPLVQIF